MAVSLLAQRWDQLDWESFSGSNKQKRRSNEDLKIELEEKNKKIEEVEGASIKRTVKS